MKLERGINLGGYLSQCKHSLAHYESFIGEDDIQKIAKWGFDHIRLPIDYEVVENADGEWYSEGSRYIEKTIALCKKYHLNLILDLHKAYGYDFNNAGNLEKNNLFSNPALQERFLTLWERMAERYGKYSDFVAFELLNEVVEDKVAENWNDLIDRALKRIREITKDTIIIYGGIQWNSANTLQYLRIPTDKNIIFTFHFYEPLVFTHQKASWIKDMDRVNSVAYPETMSYFQERTRALGHQGGAVIDSSRSNMGPDFIRDMISCAVAAAKNAGVQLYCGEFGVIDQAPAEDSLRWFEDVDSVFREFSIGCAVWSYKYMDFGIQDEHYDSIRDRLFTAWFMKEEETDITN